MIYNYVVLEIEERLPDGAHGLSLKTKVIKINGLDLGWFRWCHRQNLKNYRAAYITQTLPSNLCCQSARRVLRSRLCGRSDDQIWTCSWELEMEKSFFGSQVHSSVMHPQGAGVDLFCAAYFSGLPPLERSHCPESVFLIFNLNVSSFYWNQS